MEPYVFPPNMSSALIHLVSAVIPGYLSWVRAASQCLRLAQVPRQQGTEAGTGTGTGTGTGSGSLTGFLFPHRGLLTARRLLGRRYLQQGETLMQFT